MQGTEVICLGLGFGSCTSLETRQVLASVMGVLSDSSCTWHALGLGDEESSEGVLDGSSEELSSFDDRPSLGSGIIAVPPGKVVAFFVVVEVGSQAVTVLVQDLVVLAKDSKLGLGFSPLSENNIST